MKTDGPIETGSSSSGGADGSSGETGRRSDRLERLRRVSHPMLARFRVETSWDGGVSIRLEDTQGWQPLSGAGVMPLAPQRAFEMLERLIDLLISLDAAGALHDDIAPATLLYHPSGAMQLAPPRLEAPDRPSIDPRQSPALSPTHTPQTPTRWSIHPPHPLVQAARTFLEVQSIEPPVDAAAALELARSRLLPREWLALLDQLGVPGDTPRLSNAAALEAVRFLAFKAWPYASAVRMCISDNLVEERERERLFSLRNLLRLSPAEAARIEDFVALAEAAGWQELMPPPPSSSR